MVGAGHGCASLASRSGSAPLLLETSLFFLSSNAAGFVGLAEGWKGVSAPSARRDRQMFCCSAVPENNSLVWERALRSAGPGTEAASPSSMNSSASSTNLHLCCWVVSALAGDGNLETDFYSLGEMSFPARMGPGEISWAGISQEEDAGHRQQLASRASFPLLEPRGCPAGLQGVAGTKTKKRRRLILGLCWRGSWRGDGACERFVGPLPTSATLGQGRR